MATPDDAKARAAATYNAAADAYDSAANSFWARFGRATIERLRLPPGARVLDACCGSGASAIPAAEHVGPKGFVLGVDLAESLLALARAKAKDRGVQNVEFRAGDILDLQLPAASFDAVVCVFGIFFVPDMAAAVRALWHVVRPGGTLAITTWGPRFLEPANTAFWDSVRDVRPDLYKGFNPWDRISDPPSVLALLREGGVAHAEVRAEAGTHPVPSPEAWWSAVLGTGYRGTVEQLDAAGRERVRLANLDYVRRSGITSVEANVVYAVATKPTRERLAVLIRPETAADHDAIRSLTARAFSGLAFSDGTEPHVIDALRAANALGTSLVAVAGEQLVGHIAFSEVGPPSLQGWFALGPVSVDPSVQRRGVGTQLIEAGLRGLRAQGANGCVLLGDHRYYQRFGFSGAPSLAPPAYPAEHFQVLPFGASLPDVRVVFHPAFSVGA